MTQSDRKSHQFWTNTTSIVVALITAAAAIAVAFIPLRFGPTAGGATATAPERTQSEPAPPPVTESVAAPEPARSSSPSERPRANAEAGRAAPLQPGSAPLIGWSRTAQAERRRLDMIFAFQCPPDGEINHVAGTNPYSFGSSICSAAVHGGVITAGAGGIVKIRMLGV